MKGACMSRKVSHPFWGWVFCVSICLLCGCQASEDYRETLDEPFCGHESCDGEEEETHQTSSGSDVPSLGNDGGLTENGGAGDASSSEGNVSGEETSDGGQTEDDVGGQGNSGSQENVGEQGNSGDQGTGNGSDNGENGEDTVCEVLSLCLDPDEMTSCCSPDPVSMEAEGLTNLFWISDILYRSGQPSEGGLTSAKALGIQTILSLQLVNLDTTYEEKEQTGLALEHVSLVPWYVTEEELVEAMQIIWHAEKPVLVHCLHGSDRTGLIVALYRILFEGWTREMALYEMTEGGFGYHDEFHNLVETLETLDLERLRVSVFGEDAE